jgi:hypothetical protein
MSKFIKLLNENTPNNQDFLSELKKAGVDVKQTPTGFTFTFHINFDNEEESEDPISNAVEGMAGSTSNTPTTSQAKQLVNQRAPLKRKLLDAYKIMTQQLQKTINTIKP